MRLKRAGVAVAALAATMAVLAGSAAEAGAVLVDPAGGALVPGSIPTADRWESRYTTTNGEQWSGNGTVIPLQGDFNADALEDIFFYGPGTQPDQLWLAKVHDESNANNDRFDFVARTLNGTYKPFVGDFDGNGSDDIFWYAPGPAQDSVWYHDDDGAIALSKNVQINGTYQPIVEDFDPRTAGEEILWYSSTANESLWTAQPDGSFRSRAMGNAPSNAKVLLGNWRPDTALQDTSGTDPYYPDVFFYVPGTGADAIWAFDGDSTMTSLARTVNGSYIPVVGNFDAGVGSEFGGLTDVFWYAPGTPSDSVWINTTAATTGSITFKSVTDQVNAKTYKPFAVPSDFGPDTIVWNNPSGADFTWLPTGTKGNWSRVSSPLGLEPGTRRPFVGRFDDDLSLYGNDTYAIGVLAPNLLPLNPLTDPETGLLLEGVTEGQVEAPRVDIFWFGGGTGTGKEELFWSGDGPDLTFRYPPTEIIAIA